MPIRVDIRPWFRIIFENSLNFFKNNIYFHCSFLVCDNGKDKRSPAFSLSNNYPSKVKVFHLTAGDFQAVTRDISNGGILVGVDNYTDTIKEEDEAKVVFLDSGEANVVFNMKVVRITKSEIAMEIINCEKENTQASYALKKKEEIEKVAKGNR